MDSEEEVRRLDHRQLQEFGQGFQIGWHIPPHRNLPHTTLLLPNTFPLHLPRIAVRDLDLKKRCPHVEANGLLCLYEPNQKYSLEDPIGLVRDTISRAKTMLRRFQSKELDEDFDSEWPIYWIRGVSWHASWFSLLELSGESRLVWFTKVDSRRSFFHENPSQLERWLDNEGLVGGKVEHCVPAAFIHLTKPPKPWEFPNHGNQIRAIVEDYGTSNSSSILTDLISKNPECLHVLFHTNTGIVPFIAGAMVLPHPKLKISTDGRIEMTGFRPGNLPIEVQTQFYLSGGAPVKRVEVGRLDHLWVHGRNLDPTQEALRRKHVVLIGIGSLGSGVAELLARSGVGTLGLVDGQTLEGANLSRHSLGASSIGKNKAGRLAEKLKGDLPHLNLYSEKTNWESWYESNQASIASCDLIICCTAEWPSELSLDRLQANAVGKFPSILYGWLESYALAGHALLIPPGTPRFKDHLTEQGERCIHVFDWPEGGGTERIVCGAPHAPYGAIDLSQTQAMVARMAVKALLDGDSEPNWMTWVGSLDQVQLNGGRLHPQWAALHGEILNGSQYIQSPWPPIQS